MPDSGGDPPQVGVRAGLRLCRGGIACWGRRRFVRMGWVSVDGERARSRWQVLSRRRDRQPAYSLNRAAFGGYTHQSVGWPAVFRVANPSAGGHTHQVRPADPPNVVGPRGGLCQWAGYAATVGRTTLVDADRLALAEQADRIVVLDQGRAVESGNTCCLAGSRWVLCPAVV